MRMSIKEMIGPMIVTLLILIILEIVSTALLPIFGFTKYLIPFNILIILFMGFKLETPILAILILVTQYFHSFFSIGGWEMGTIAGVLVCIIISYLRGMIHFTSSAMTIFVTQIFQIFWFVVMALLIYIKLGTAEFILAKFWRFIPESIVISLISPTFFAILDKIWRVRDDGLLGDNS